MQVGFGQGISLILRDFFMERLGKYREQIRETGKKTGPIRPSKEHTKRGGTAGIHFLNASSPAEWIRLGSPCRGFFSGFRQKKGEKLCGRL